MTLHLFGDIGLLLLGLLLLYLGAEWLVKGAAGLARELGVRPLVIGMTAVAYGTSAPELVVSGIAALEGRGDIAIGNVVGSNIANIGLILGVTALVQPIQVDRWLSRREIPVLVVVTALLPLVLLDDVVSRWEAALLLVGAVAFTLASIMIGVPGGEETATLVEQDAEVGGAPSGGGKVRLALIGIVGLLLLLGGGKMLVEGASALALRLGMSERLVGLTIVAIGTSIPELAASLVAAVRGHAGIAVGNVIGSNIFNVLFVVGGAGLIRPFGGKLGDFSMGLIALAVFTLAAVVFMRSARHITRVEGVVLTLAYAGFLVLVSIT